MVSPSTLAAIAIIIAGEALLIGGSIWMYRDAKRRDAAHPVAWPLLSLIGLQPLIVPGLVVILAYFVLRGPVTTAAEGRTPSAGDSAA